MTTNLVSNVTYRTYLIIPAFSLVIPCYLLFLLLYSNPYLLTYLLTHNLPSSAPVPSLPILHPYKFPPPLITFILIQTNVICMLYCVTLCHVMLQLKIANYSCEGRVVSALEGGYQIGEHSCQSVRQSVNQHFTALYIYVHAHSFISSHYSILYDSSFTL